MALSWSKYSDFNYESVEHGFRDLSLIRRTSISFMIE